MVDAGARCRLLAAADSQNDENVIAGVIAGWRRRALALGVGLGWWPGGEYNGVKWVVLGVVILWEETLLVGQGNVTTD